MTLASSFRALATKLPMSDRAGVSMSMSKRIFESHSPLLKMFL